MTAPTHMHPSEVAEIVRRDDRSSLLKRAADMTAEQRQSEIAAILFASYVRQRTVPSTENPDKRVDVFRESTPPCQNGLTDPVEAEA